MSRSFKHKPLGTARGSDKYCKQVANRRYRTLIRSLIHRSTDLLHLPLMREVSNVYAFNKDTLKWMESGSRKVRK